MWWSKRVLYLIKRLFIRKCHPPDCAINSKKHVSNQCSTLPHPQLFLTDSMQNVLYVKPTWPNVITTIVFIYYLHCIILK